MQTIFDVWESKAMLDKTLGQSLGAEATAKYWKDNVDKTYHVEEPHTPAMVDACFTIKKRLLNRPTCGTVEALVDADSHECTPFKSVYKYEAVIKRAPTEVSMMWCFSGLLDLCRAGLATEG